jgi:hypothetical protein
MSAARRRTGTGDEPTPATNRQQWAADLDGQGDELSDAISSAKTFSVRGPRSYARLSVALSAEPLIVSATTNQ